MAQRMISEELVSTSPKVLVDELEEPVAVLVQSDFFGVLV